MIETSSLGTSDTVVTCHVTGFHPRALQVEWLNQEGHILDRVSNGEVLPNGDGTYQIRRTLSVPDGARWSQFYRCQVVHSGVTGNITLEWSKTSTSTAGQKYFGSATNLTVVVLECKL